MPRVNLALLIPNRLLASEYVKIISDAFTQTHFFFPRLPCFSNLRLAKKSINSCGETPFRDKNALELIRSRPMTITFDFFGLLNKQTSFLINECGFTDEMILRWDLILIMATP